MDHWREYVDKLGLFAFICFGQAAGLLAAYGSERYQGRSPGWKWFLNRLLLFPMSALGIMYAVSRFNLNDDAALFFASVLSFLSYEAFQIARVVALRRARKEVADLTDLLSDPNTYTKIETVQDQSGSAKGVKLEIISPDGQVRKPASKLFTPTRVAGPLRDILNKVGNENKE